jgi:hypothetical protein
MGSEKVRMGSGGGEVCVGRLKSGKEDYDRVWAGRHQQLDI